MPNPKALPNILYSFLASGLRNSRVLRVEKADLSIQKSLRNLFRWGQEWWSSHATLGLILSITWRASVPNAVWIFVSWAPNLLSLPHKPCPLECRLAGWELMLQELKTWAASLPHIRECKAVFWREFVWESDCDWILGLPLTIWATLSLPFSTLIEGIKWHSINQVPCVVPDTIGAQLMIVTTQAKIVITAQFH